jgi:hypothetical protein
LSIESSLSHINIRNIASDLYIYTYISIYEILDWVEDARFERNKELCHALFPLFLGVAPKNMKGVIISLTDRYVLT